MVTSPMLPFAGLSLLPHTKRPSVEGNKLYTLGPAVFYVYSDVVHLEKSRRVDGNAVTTFVPVTVEELMARAKKAA